MIPREDIELIEQYINGALPEDQRRAVEQRLATDEDFREEMDLQRHMHEHFREEGRQRFREVVRGVMEGEAIPQKAPEVPWSGRSGASILNWVGLLIVLLLTGFFIWRACNPSLPAPADNQNQPVAPPQQEEPETRPDTVLPFPNPVEQKPTVKTPIASVDPANFVPNASMEALVQGGMMSESLTLNVANPLNGADFKSGKNRITVVPFSGTVEALAGVDSVAFVLAVFNNREVRKPLDVFPFNVIKDASGTFHFDFQRPLKLTPGLYYFTIDDREGVRVYTGKFTVGKHKK